MPRPKKKNVEVLEAVEVTEVIKSITTRTEEALPAPSVAPDVPAPPAPDPSSALPGKVAKAVAMTEFYEVKVAAMKEVAEQYKATERMQKRLFDAKMGRLTNKKNRRGARKPKPGLAMKESFRMYEAIVALYEAQLRSVRGQLVAEEAAHDVSRCQMNACVLASEHLLHRR